MPYMVVMCNCDLKLGYKNKTKKQKKGIENENSHVNFSNATHTFCENNERG